MTKQSIAVRLEISLQLWGMRYSSIEDAAIGGFIFQNYTRDNGAEVKNGHFVIVRTLSLSLSRRDTSSILNPAIRTRGRNKNMYARADSNETTFPERVNAVCESRGCCEPCDNIYSSPPCARIRARMRARFFAHVARNQGVIRGRYVPTAVRGPPRFFAGHDEGLESTARREVWTGPGGRREKGVGREGASAAPVK